MTEAWDRANLVVAQRAVDNGLPAEALRPLGESAEPLISLGEGRHELASVAALHLTTGDAVTAAVDTGGATF